MAVSASGVASLLEEHLVLQSPPAALAWVQAQPDGVPRLEQSAPSACAIWRLAETQLSYAAAPDHFNCPLGAMVMGFNLPEPQGAALQDELGMMCGIEYVREDELAHVPAVHGATAGQAPGIVYGPLAGFPLQPDLFLLWLTPEQSMIVSEACGLINWSAAPRGLLGRPGCAALPVALRDGSPAQSLGCVGMRFNTGVSGELLLMAVPWAAAEMVHANLSRVAVIHGQMEAHYRERKAALDASGGG